VAQEPDYGVRHGCIRDPGLRLIDAAPIERVGLGRDLARAGATSIHLRSASRGRKKRCRIAASVRELGAVPQQVLGCAPFVGPVVDPRGYQDEAPSEGRASDVAPA
jgi:hypothetical protein